MCPVILFLGHSFRIVWSHPWTLKIISFQVFLVWLWFTGSADWLWPNVLTVAISQLVACVTLSQHTCWLDYCDDEQQWRQWISLEYSFRIFTSPSIFPQALSCVFQLPMLFFSSLLMLWAIPTNMSLIPESTSVAPCHRPSCSLSMPCLDSYVFFYSSSIPSCQWIADPLYLACSFYIIQWQIIPVKMSIYVFGNETHEQLEGCWQTCYGSVISVLWSLYSSFTAKLVLPSTTHCGTFQ